MWKFREASRKKNRIKKLIGVLNGGGRGEGGGHKEEGCGPRCSGGGKSMRMAWRRDPAAWETWGFGWAPAEEGLMSLRACPPSSWQRQF